MEAWLKFQAPGITVTLGLGIGRLVFGALNKVEIIFAVSLIVSTIADKRLRTTDFYILSIPLILLALQSIWLLPSLDARAELFIQGNPPPSSYLHFLYILLEVIKVVVLFVYGVKQFETIKNHH